MLFWFALTSFVSLLVGAALMRRFGMTITRVVDAQPYTCFRCGALERSLYCEQCTVLVNESKQPTPQLDDATSVDWSTRQPPASVVPTEGDTHNAIP